MIRRRGIAALTFACGLGLAPGPAAAQDLAGMVQAVKQAQDSNTLFGSVEMRSDSLRGLQQWQRVVSAMKIAGPSYNDCAADAAACTTPVLQKWRSAVVAARGLPYGDRPKAVNDFFNDWPYKLDMELWGVREYWEVPKEFIARSGDCEDYSIAKYYALRNAGYSKDELRVVAVRDTIRGLGHAILAVYLNGDILILDNLSRIVAPHTRYKHYQPQVSMNETTRWAHVGGFAAGTVSPPPATSSGLSASNLFRKR